MKRYSIFRDKKILFVLGVLLVFFIFLSIFIVPNLGQWLVVMDELQESDMIVDKEGCKLQVTGCELGNKIQKMQDYSIVQFTYSPIDQLKRKIAKTVSSI